MTALMVGVWGVVVSASAQPTLWLRADSVVEADGRVSEWTDLSGNGRHASQIDAGRQPFWVAADDRAGGQPVVQFDGNEWLDVDATFLSNSAYTVVAVVGREPPSRSVVANFFVAGSTIGRNQNLVLGWERDQLLRQAHFGNDLDAAVPPFRTRQYSVLTFRFDPSEGRELYVEQERVAVDGDTRPVVDNLGTRIGHFPAFPQFYFHGSLAELRFYDTPLGEAELADVQADLMTRYGTELPVPFLPLPGVLALGLSLAGAATWMLREDEA